MREAVEARIAQEASRLADAGTNLSMTIDEDLGRLSEDRTRLAETIRNEIGQVNTTFSDQIGVIEERTRTMEAALAIGVDRVRQTLENSALVAAGALRDKVAEATGSLGEETARVMDSVDERLAASVVNSA